MPVVQSVIDYSEGAEDLGDYNDISVQKDEYQEEEQEVPQNAIQVQDVTSIQLNGQVLLYCMA